MPNEPELSSVLGEFAQTVVTDFPIQQILDHLVLRIVEILPITGAGVTLIAPNAKPIFVAASDESALRFEQLQSELGEGPCLEAYRTGEAVVMEDLRSDDRFGNFSPRAIEAGLAAVATFPLREGDNSLGALDLYRDTPGPLDADDMAAAQTLADVTAGYLVSARTHDESRQKSDLGSLLPPEPGGGSAPASNAERIATLERHLLRFAAELHAGGWRDAHPPAVDAARFPALDRLPARQREIVAHLLRGERIPLIAASMYISASTVRNHLTHVYSAFGVHSQVALLALLRTDPDATKVASPGSGHAGQPGR